MTPFQRLQAHAAVVKVAARAVARQTNWLADPADLEQVGIAALLQMNLDDCASETARAAYVGKRARGAMLDALRQIDPCARSVRSLTRAIARAAHRLEQALGRRPRDVEIAAAANLDLDEYYAALGAPFSCGPAGEVLDSSPADAAFLATHEVSHGADPLDTVMRAQMQRAVARAIAELPTRERNVILAMSIGEPMSVTGAQMGVSESRVCQIRKAAIERIRASMAKQGFV
jgi:RNA polymerase sigma factor for flagellar operon FliA